MRVRPVSFSGQSPNPTVIDPSRPGVTLINVFRVAPDRCDELLGVLVAATRDVMRGVPGFVSANFHRALDGTRVTNYAQWASRGAFEAMLRDPAAREHMGRAAAIAESFDANLYEVACCERASGEEA